MPTDQSLTETVAAEIRAEMARQNKKRAELATALGMVPSAIGDRIGGKKPFDTAELEKIARWLGIDLVQLVSPRSYRPAA